jgi:D-alanine-D-alanine ligase
VRRLRILVLMHPTLVPPDSLEGQPEEEVFRWKTEYDVVSTLRALRHEVRPLGVQYELLPIREAVDEWKPHVVFNMLEEFHGLSEFDQHVVSYLELLRVPYSGCNPRGMVLARDKALSKKVAAYHRIRAPRFAAFPRHRRARKPAGLAYPLIVKSLTEEASLGISQASVVWSDDKLAERVEFVHEKVGSDAIVEEFVEGRELYVGVFGNARASVLPVWELLFEKLPPGAAAIATARVKHNPRYQEERGIYQRRAERLPPGAEERLRRTSRRIYHLLGLDGYARLDYRLREDGEVFFLEANPNPDIARSEEFASSAEAAGIGYAELLRRLVALGLSRGR